MKILSAVLLPVILGTMLTAVIATSCAGTKARENVLMPAMALAWSTVIAPHAERGGADVVQLDNVQVLLDSGDRDAAAAIAAAWLSLREDALRGIDLRLAVGEIGPNGANVFRETVRQFTARVAQLL